MPVSIQVDGISKKYRIGAVRRNLMIREQLMETFRRPFRRAGEAEIIWALRDVSFSVNQGEVVGIIGRNGAGKSTLLKVLSRITTPTSGAVKVVGRVASLLEVGTGFHDELTGRENVFLNGSILGMTKREVEARFDQIVEFAGISRFIDTPIKRYSSGMRMRLGFAVAAHLEPDVLVVDEVLAVGDAGFQKKCLNAMEDLRSGGRTVLFVSHNMAAVENLCGRGIWLDGGKVRDDGPALEVIRTYMGTFASEQATVTDLSNSTNRHGTGDIKYVGLEMLDSDGNPLPVVRAGEPLTLRMHYEARKPIARPSFGYRMFTEYGTLVAEVGFVHYGIDVPLLPPGRGYVDMTIHSLNLMPARITLSLYITTPGVMHDALEHCAVLEVEASDIWDSGKIPDARLGIVFFKHAWKINGRPVSRMTEIDESYFDGAGAHEERSPSGT